MDEMGIVQDRCGGFPRQTVGSKISDGQHFVEEGAGESSHDTAPIRAAWRPLRPAASLPPRKVLQDRLGRQARGLASHKTPCAAREVVRRRWHRFNSMTSERAGKCAFHLRRIPTSIEDPGALAGHE